MNYITSDGKKVFKVTEIDNDKMTKLIGELIQHYSKYEHRVLFGDEITSYRPEDITNIKRKGTMLESVGTEEQGHPSNIPRSMIEADCRVIPTLAKLALSILDGDEEALKELMEFVPSKEPLIRWSLVEKVQSQLDDLKNGQTELTDSVITANIGLSNSLEIAVKLSENYTTQLQRCVTMEFQKTEDFHI